MLGGRTAMLRRASVRLGFTFKPGESIRIRREGLWKDFERYVAVELRISGSIHPAHAAFADLGGDGIRAEGGAGF